MSNKGLDYENFAYHFFSNLINQGFFSFPSSQCKLTPQKTFYSKDREKNIFFDLVLEIFLPFQEDPFLIFIIECKNYSHKVPVDDIEEFASKIDQIRYLKIHPILITTVGFQSGGLTFSKNRGITLWKVTNNSQCPEIILNRQKRNLSTLNDHIKNALTDENYNEWKFGNIFIQTPKKYTLYPRDYINEIIFSKEESKLLYIKFKEHKINVPYLSKYKISKIAEEVYCKYKTEHGELLILEILNDLKINLIIKENLIDLDTIGEINFKIKQITLFGKNTFSESQLNFAIAHEIGHFILGHDKYLNNEIQNSLNISKNIQTFNLLSINLDRIEYQANYFAACLLLPEKELKQSFYSLLKKYDITYRGFSYLYVDDQQCNLNNYLNVCRPLIKKFSVSKETLKIRLEELGLAKFVRSFDKLNQN